MPTPLASPLRSAAAGDDPSRPAGYSPLRGHRWGVLLAAFWIAGTLLCQVAAEPIRLHPDNPHYFLFRGKPTVLVTSAEHYGAVLNLDFDYVHYLEALKSDALNLTRIWPGGPYLEIPGSFNIANNTLAPKPNRFSCIWQRSTTPGYAGLQSSRHRSDGHDRGHERNLVEAGAKRLHAAHFGPFAVLCTSSHSTFRHD